MTTPRPSGDAAPRTPSPAPAASPPATETTTAATRDPATGDTVEARWSVVMPVKGGASAKSRLRDARRVALARSVALDAVAAALACHRVGRVVVVTGDADCARELAALGAAVVADPGTGLDGALLAGAAACDPLRPCALLLADLPALRPDDLAAVLDDCLDVLTGPAVPAGPAAPRMVTVPDADGTGTVLLAAGRPTRLRPAFGPGSAAAHAARATVLPGAPAGLRRDVDTEAHLRVAVELGVGTRTAQVLGVQPRSTIAPSDASFSPNRS